MTPWSTSGRKCFRFQTVLVDSYGDYEKYPSALKVDLYSCRIFSNRGNIGC